MRLQEHKAQPQGWTLTTLGEIASFEMGQAPPGESSNFDGIGTPFVKAGEFGELTPEIREWTTAPLRYGTIHDVFICVVGATAGKLNLGADCAIGRSVAAIRPQTHELQKTIYYQLLPRVLELRAGSSGSAQGVISKGDLSSIEVALAPAAEQTRIVAKLEELLSDLDAGVAELNAAQAKLAQYRQSLLKAAVSGELTAAWRRDHPIAETGAELLARILRERRARWEQQQRERHAAQDKPLPKNWQHKYPEPVAPDTTGLPELPQGWTWASVEQIASDERYSLAIGPFGSNLKVSDYKDAGVPLVFVRNIRTANYGGSYTRFVSPQKADELAAHRVASGDVLVTKMGDPPGDADVYPSDQPSAVITADCVKVTCCPDLMMPVLLKSVINSPLGRQQIGPMTQGVAQKKVSLGRFASFAVPMPSFHEQKAIVCELERVMEACNQQDAAITHTLALSTAQRQNILRAAFAGELVPQDPRDEPASVLLARIRAERATQAIPSKPRRRKTKDAA